MDRKILAAGAGIIASAGLFVMLVARSKGKKLLKAEKIRRPDNSEEARVDHDEHAGNIETANYEDFSARHETTDNSPIVEQKDQPADRTAFDAARQKVQTGRRVGQYDDEMNLINEFESAAAAAKAVGSNRTSIRDAANGKQKHAAGFVWKYLE